MLETTKFCKDELQKEKVAELLKEIDELQNLRADLQNIYLNLLGFGG